MIVPDFFCDSSDTSIYRKLVEELREVQKNEPKAEWIPWHEGCHLISKVCLSRSGLDAGFGVFSSFKWLCTLSTLSSSDSALSMPTYPTPSPLPRVLTVLHWDVLYSVRQRFMQAPDNSRTYQRILDQMIEFFNIKRSSCGTRFNW